MSAIITAEGTAQASHHHFTILDVDPSRDFFKDANPYESGLAGVTEGAIVILTGIYRGPVTVTIETHSGDPGGIDSAWEESWQSEFISPEGEARVANWDLSRVQDLPTITFEGPGRYQVRICASGRMLMQNRVASDPVERYLIQVWPA